MFCAGLKYSYLFTLLIQSSPSTDMIYFFSDSFPLSLFTLEKILYVSFNELHAYLPLW